MRVGRLISSWRWIGQAKLVFARIYRKATKLVAAGFLKALTGTVPYRIHTVLTDNGVQFIPHDRKAAEGFVSHVFGRVCAERGIEHRLTKPYLRGPTVRPNAWCAPSRRPLSAPSTLLP